MQRFERNLEENIFKLHSDLKYHRYEHGGYSSYFVRDPKQRHIHKATVKDRLFHHAIFQVLNPIFDPIFISHSFSCREGKGTHKGVTVLENILQKAFRNGRGNCFVLKCDIWRFFETVDQKILLDILARRIKDAEVMSLLKSVVESFKDGLPIGNLTSQLFANIYLNEFDQFVKHKLKIKYYVRYTDDFILVSRNRQQLVKLFLCNWYFLKSELGLNIHLRKVSIRKFRQGIDFLGYVILPYHRMLRTKTKNRIFRKLQRRVTECKSGQISNNTLQQSLASYLGVFSHANTRLLSQNLQNRLQLWLRE